MWKEAAQATCRRSMPCFRTSYRYGMSICDTTMVSGRHGCMPFSLHPLFFQSQSSKARLSQSSALTRHLMCCPTATLTSSGTHQTGSSMVLRLFWHVWTDLARTQALTSSWTAIQAQSHSERAGSETRLANRYHRRGHGLCFRKGLPGCKDWWQ